MAVGAGIKKELFFRMMAPLILKSNEDILAGYFTLQSAGYSTDTQSSTHQPRFHQLLITFTPMTLLTTVYRLFAGQAEPVVAHRQVGSGMRPVFKNLLIRNQLLELCSFVTGVAGP